MTETTEAVTPPTPEPFSDPKPTNSRTLLSLGGALWGELNSDEQEAFIKFVKAHWDVIATKI